MQMLFCFFIEKDFIFFLKCIFLREESGLNKPSFTLFIMYKTRFYVF